MKKIENEFKNIRMYDISVFLLNFMMLVVVTTGILLFVGVSVTEWNLLFALITAMSITYYLKKSIQETIIISISATIIFILLTLIAGSVYDNTWDGAAYHKQAIGFLAEGWNPLLQSSMHFNELSQSITYQADNPMFWAEVYPKATWYFAASIYRLTGNIESGKVYTLLFIVISGGIFYDYFRSIQLKKWQANIAALVLVLNPITLAQFQTYYIDGLVSNLLMLLILMFIACYTTDYKHSNKEKFNIIFCLIIFGCNLKFSVLLFTATYCIVFFIIDSVYRIKDKNYNNKRFTFFFGTAIFSILVIGFSPYITNIIRYQNPFYGFVGEKTLISKEQMDFYFGIEGLNNIEMFFASLFGQMSHGEHKTLSELLKLPFTFNKSELQYYYIPDTRVGGFGIFSSGIFILSSIIIGLVSRKTWKKDNRSFKCCIILISVTLLEILLLPSNYQFRYVGHLYIIVGIALVFLFIYCNKIKSKVKWLKFLTCFMLIFIIGNSLPWIMPAMNRIKSSMDTTAVLNRLKNISIDKEVKLSLWVSDFSGINYNFKDFDIRHELVPFDKTDESYSRTFFDWVYYKVEE